MHAKVIVVAVVALLGTALLAENERNAIQPGLLTDAYIPLVIIGEGWSQQIAIQNLDEEESIAGTLKFFTAEGEPWQVNLTGRGTSDTFFVTLLPGQLAVYETVVAFHPQVLGYAHIDVDCCPRSLVQTIFRRQEANRPDLMTSLPIDDASLRSVHIMFDNRGGKYAGVGILTTGPCYSFSCETVMDLVFRDEMGNVLLQQQRTQRNGTLWWFSLSAEFPQVAGILGSLEVNSGDPDTEYVSAVGFSLQFAPNGAFTAVTSAERQLAWVQGGFLSSWASRGGGLLGTG